MKIKLILSLIFATTLLVSCGDSKKMVAQGSAHPEWSYDDTIYEINTRQFSPEGTFAAVEEQLPRLKDMGVDILWFMPIQPIGEKNRKGELGSYYSIKDYTAVNPEYGTMDDFKRLVKKAHDLDMKVMLDWVANHTAWDSEWIDNEEWYVRDSAGNLVTPYDWTDVVELNFDNHDMRKKMKKEMEFWIKEADVDGFRNDMALEVPVEFWNEIIPELKKSKADLFMLAEAEDTSLNKSFDMSYGWEVHHIMNNIAQGKSNASALRDYVLSDIKKYPKESIRMIFTSNHDENSWAGTEFERMGDAAKEFAVLTYLLPGMPLIYNGQETGFDRRLEFFKKDSIDWNDKGGYTQLYTTLNKLRKNNPALHSGERGGDFFNIDNDMPNDVFSFERKIDNNSVIGIFNFTNKPQTVTLKGRGYEGEYNELFIGTKQIIKRNTQYTLPAWGYHVFYK